MYFHYIPLRITPDRGFCEAVCDRKVSDKFRNFESIMLKNIISRQKRIATERNNTTGGDRFSGSMTVLLSVLCV